MPVDDFFQNTLKKRSVLQYRTEELKGENIGKVRFRADGSGVLHWISVSLKAELLGSRVLGIIVDEDTENPVKFKVDKKQNAFRSFEMRTDEKLRRIRYSGSLYFRRSIQVELEGRAVDASELNVGVSALTGEAIEAQTTDSGRRVPSGLFEIPADVGVRTLQLSATVSANNSRTLFDLSASGIVRGLELIRKEDNAQAWQHSVLQIFYDGAAEPAIQAPLKDFFAQSFGISETGEESKRYILRLPMPFSSRLVIRIRNFSNRALKLQTRMLYEERKDTESFLRLHGLWFSRRGVRELDDLVATTGEGRLAGISMRVKDLDYRQNLPLRTLGSRMSISCDGNVIMPGTRLDVLAGGSDFFWHNTNRHSGNGVEKVNVETGEASVYRLFFPENYSFQETAGFSVTADSVQNGPALLEGIVWVYLDRNAGHSVDGLSARKMTDFVGRGYWGEGVIDAYDLNVLKGLGKISRIEVERLPGRDWVGKGILSYLPETAFGELTLEFPRPNIPDQFSLWFAGIRGPGGGSLSLKSDAYSSPSAPYQLGGISTSPTGMIYLGEVGLSAESPQIRLEYSLPLRSAELPLMIDAFRLKPGTRNYVNQLSLAGPLSQNEVVALSSLNLSEDTPMPVGFTILTHPSAKNYDNDGVFHVLRMTGRKEGIYAVQLSLVSPEEGLRVSLAVEHETGQRREAPLFYFEGGAVFPEFIGYQEERQKYAFPMTLKRGKTRGVLVVQLGDSGFMRLRLADMTARGAISSP